MFGFFTQSFKFMQNSSCCSDRNSAQMSSNLQVDPDKSGKLSLNLRDQNYISPSEFLTSEQEELEIEYQYQSNQKNAIKTPYTNQNPETGGYIQIHDQTNTQSQNNNSLLKNDGQTNQIQPLGVQLTQSQSQTQQIKKKRHIKIWTMEEDEKLKYFYKKCNGKWPIIAEQMDGRNASQCSQRWRRIKPEKVRRPWTKAEDQRVLELVHQLGKNWGAIATHIQGRSGKQVRERYINKLDNAISQTKWTQEEDNLILELFFRIGPKWSEISKYLQGRPENKVKNRFYSHIKKTLYPDNLSNNTGSPDRNANSETATNNINNSPITKDYNDKNFSESFGEEELSKLKHQRSKNYESDNSSEYINSMDEDSSINNDYQLSSEQQQMKQEESQTNNISQAIIRNQQMHPGTQFQPVHLMQKQQNQPQLSKIEEEQSVSSNSNIMSSLKQSVQNMSLSNNIQIPSRKASFFPQDMQFQPKFDDQSQNQLNSQLILNGFEDYSNYMFLQNANYNDDFNLKTPSPQGTPEHKRNHVNLGFNNNKQQQIQQQQPQHGMNGYQQQPQLKASLQVNGVKEEDIKYNQEPTQEELIRMQQQLEMELNNVRVRLNKYNEQTSGVNENGKQ